MARTLRLWMASGIPLPKAGIILDGTSVIAEIISLVEILPRCYEGPITAGAGHYNVNLISNVAVIGGDVEVVIGATDGVTYEAQSGADIRDKTDNLPPDPADNSDIIDAINALAPLIGPIVTPTATEVTDADIASLALSPKKIVTDEGSVEERSVGELIKADQHVAAQAIGDLPLHGLRMSKFKPAGAV